LTVEALEGRTLLSTWTVNSLGDLPFDARTVLLPADGGAVFDVPLAGGLTIPPDRPVVAGVSLSLVALGLGPAFAPQLGRRGAVVSAAFQVAQPVTIDQPLSVTRLDLYVQRRGPDASLTVELRADTDGEPRGALLASATPSALPDGDFDWLAATFDRPSRAPTEARLDRAPHDRGKWNGAAMRSSAMAGGPVQPRPRQHLAGPPPFRERIRAFPNPLTIDITVDGKTHTGVRSGCLSAHVDASTPSVPGSTMPSPAGSIGRCSTRLAASAAPLNPAHTLRRDVRAGRCSRRLKVRSSWSAGQQATGAARAHRHWTDRVGAATQQFPTLVFTARHFEPSRTRMSPPRGSHGIDDAFSANGSGPFGLPAPLQPLRAVECGTSPAAERVSCFASAMTTRSTTSTVRCD
jgi:hypothetical protein